MLISELPAWPNTWFFLWRISVCCFCQLCVFDPLLAAIFSQGKSCQPCTGIQGGHLPPPLTQAVYELPAGYVMSHSAGARSHSNVHNFAPGSSLLPFRMAELLICFHYAMCLKHCTFCFLGILFLLPILLPLQNLEGAMGLSHPQGTHALHPVTRVQIRLINFTKNITSVSVFYPNGIFYIRYLYITCIPMTPFMYITHTNTCVCTHKHTSASNNFLV